MSRNTQAADDGPSRPNGAFGDSNQIDEDDVLETESVLSSAAGDYEKENHTPKFPDDMTNPFFVGGGTSELKRLNRPPKLDGSTTPTGTGSIIRSRRLALGSISPWRWNTFDEQVSLAALYGANGGKDIGKDIGKTLGKDLGKDLGLFSADGLGSKSGYAISEWIESADHSRNTIPSGDSGGPSSLVPSSSSSSSSSSTLPSKGWQNVGSKTMSSAPAVASSSSTSLPSSGPLPFNKGLVGKLPENHPNSAEAAERKDGSSAVVAKLTETYIQPTTLAFNRRAQQVAGRIYYWKHGNYHLVSEQDKQQWPGEWKFDVYQDPMVHEGPSLIEGSSGSSSSASYTGKGKLTDRQLSGPASKRARVHRESFGGFQEMASNSSGGGGSGGSGGSSVSGSSTIPQQQQHQDMELSGSPGVGHEREVTPPPSPISRVSKKHLQERYDFRERRMLNEPLTPRPRRCGA
ncbi:hypothetical protein BGZ99_007612 [Dissophora globulifera]|uniref:Uncharacterized protein n=1 Tax=Dissophora globulifera TaxID=979702 RepID=A0A9P6UPI0_9FUNG|nr:hypothetical protein BGZ99_007612 [Dissophora globulifera]